ncbi:S-layer homology domain-containing protein [Solibacillus sp. FSL W7-1472]|uniref:S-layer homology domain-containing protein n=1 Tax=Solibacillus sp. FSL W7-1472 TaxID=2921707 RepID=UPI0007FB4AB4|nr:S-layer homology domain-containing protein [Solibacillus silvestris]OBW60602.1 Parasporal protein [Solibacillus silvestris]
MKKRLMTVFSVLILACSLPLSGTFAASSTKQFSDVPSSKYFANAVYDLAERNIIGGYPDGTFKPGNSITRGQAAAIIAKLMKLDMDNIENPGFKDVSAKNGYYKAIAAMAKEGIISGYGDGRYGPNDPIKRGQMASILVKAFDLPRYGFYEIENPFKDVKEYEAHGSNILILYRVGITSGTSPDKFSPNAPITRGQAAKMMKATEDAKPTMVTLEASDLGLDWVSVIAKEQERNSDLFKAIRVQGRNTPEGYIGDRIQLVPLKEGEGTLNLYGRVDEKTSDISYIYKKYYVHIKKENGELKLTLEETNDFQPTAVELSFWNGTSKSSSEAVRSVQNVSLATIDGKKLSDNVKFTQCKDYSICIDIDQPGEYIATARSTGGKEVRFAIEAKQPINALFNYDIKTLREQLTVVFDLTTHLERYRFDVEASKNIGKHNILTKDADQIATVTRDPGTSRFRAEAKEVGTIEIEFENETSWIMGVPGDSISGSTTGIRIDVQRMGEITNISINDIFYINPDM